MIGIYPRCAGTFLETQLSAYSKTMTASSWTSGAKVVRLPEQKVFEDNQVNNRQFGKVTEELVPYVANLPSLAPLLSAFSHGS